MMGPSFGAVEDCYLRVRIFPRFASSACLDPTRSVDCAPVSSFQLPMLAISPRSIIKRLDRVQPLLTAVLIVLRLV